MPQQVVTPDPIAEPIAPSGLKAGLKEVVTIPPSASSGGLARLNFLYHADDDSGRIFTADSRGKIWLIDEGTLDPEPFLDVADQSGFFHSFQAGVRSFAFHPDFDEPGQPGFGRFYTLATFSESSAPPDVPILETKVSAVLLQDALTEWQVSATDPTQIDPASAREILRIDEPLLDHNADQIMFDPNATAGGSDFGMLYLGTGDGGNVPDDPDPLDNAQDLGSALGKILRIDPLEQADGAPYGIPEDNPFLDVSAALPEIWALGLRHPQNFSFDTGGDGDLFISDIGQSNIEEVNLGQAGANYGWNLREGTFATVDGDPESLLTLPDNDASLGFTYPVAQYDRSEESPDGRAAVTGGFVYRGSEIPQLVGHYVFGDLATGRVFHIPAAGLTAGAPATIGELTFIVDGEALQIIDLLGTDRADIRFGQDEAGELYITSKRDGVVRKLTAAPPQSDDYPADETTDGIVIVSGAAGVGAIETPSDTDWLAVDLVEGRGYRFDIAGRGADALQDPFARLFDANGTLLISNNNGGPGQAARLDYTATSTGSHFVQVHEAGRDAHGDYDIVAIERIIDDYKGNANTTGVVTTDGMPLLGSIETPDDVDWFAVDLQAEQTYQIDIGGRGESALADAFARLRTADGTLLLSNNDSGPGNDARMTFAPASSGSYFIQVNEFERDASGDYQITVQPVLVDDYRGNAATTGSVGTDGTATTGAIERDVDIDWLAVELTAGVQYQISVIGTGATPLMDPIGRLRAGDGDLLAVDNNGGLGLNSRIDYQAQQDGIHYVQVNEAGRDATGTYEVFIETLGDGFGSGISPRPEIESIISATVIA